MGPGKDKTFYGLQSEFRRKSLLVFAVLILFYIVSFGVLVLMVDAGIGLAFAKPRMLAFSHLAGLLVVAVVFALGLGIFHYYDAKNNGAAYILKRLSARPAELRDRYHREMEDVVEAVRLASGVPRARAVAIPDPAVNSLVVVEPDGTACVAMTEGLLAALTRDEITAAAAHELAHVARGDAVLMTFICALTDFYERLWEGLQPSRPRESDDIMPLSEVLIRLLGRFLSRERETLADAAAVEISRDPAALARAIFKAHLSSGFVGEFRSAYAPLFIVSPDAPEDDGGRPAGWSGSHPPVMTRIKLLAELAHIAPEDVIQQVWDEQAKRESAKEVVSVHEDAPVAIAVPRVSKPEAPGACPRCGVPLVENCYEGVYLGQCRRCGGHLVDESALPRLLARTEVGFSEDLRRKAHDFKDRFLRNPVNTLKINEAFLPQAVCPSCRGKMRIRPFSYQYFVPVDRCFSCEKTWFDGDELEILQVLVEEAKK
jgi:Zn-dependent protease with chaperone function/Zn-finger nucleic acid-binding protein